MRTIDLSQTSLRDFNAALHRLKPTTNETHWRVLNPRGQHAIAAGVDAPVTVEIEGHVGYYCAGMNKEATVIVNGCAGQGVAENMMSGRVHVKGDVSQGAGATGCGGLLVVEGNASARCGISMKGIDIVVKGLGRPSCRAFMAPSRQSRRARRCRRCAWRFDLRGAAVRARHASRASAPTASRSRCAMSTRVTSCKTAGGGRLERQRRSMPGSSAATAPPASSITSTSTTSELTDERRDRWIHTPPRPSATFDEYAIAEIRRAAATGIYDIRGFGGASAGCRISTICCSSAPRVSRYPLEGYREKCATDVRLGTRFAKKPIKLKIPITIAGMSFGSLSAQAKEALGRGATAWAPRPRPATAA